jgi:hypothetical protein
VGNISRSDFIRSQVSKDGIAYVDLDLDLDDDDDENYIL